MSAGESIYGPRSGLIGTATPATTSTTRSHAAARRWLSSPSASANRRPASVAGTTVRPTSGLTSTSGEGYAATASVRSVTASATEPAAHASVRSIAAVSQPPTSSTSVAISGSARNCIATSALSTVCQFAGRRVRWAATRVAQAGSESVAGPVARYRTGADGGTNPTTACSGQ